jgi:hypothetical protein
MFKLQRVFAACFPGHLGIQPYAGIDKADQMIRDFMANLPPELALPEGYMPAPTESPVEIIRRYTIATEIQGSFITLHRPYLIKSTSLHNAVVAAAWKLYSYQSQIMALSDILEPFAWYIEEYLDPHLFRGSATLAFTLIREPTIPDADMIVMRIRECAELGKAKSLRKKDCAKVYGIFRAMLMTLSERIERDGTDIQEQINVPAAPVSPPMSFPQENAFGVMDWNMQDMLVDPMFRWDEYLVDMVLDTDLAPV